MNTPAASWRFVGMLAVVVAAAVAAPTRAAVVLVDFGSDASFRGATVPNPDPNGHSWNSIAPGAFVLNMIYFALGFAAFSFFLQSARRHGTLVQMGE